MTNPVRILNSVSPTVRPTGRSPGEPFVNYPDLQFGVVDVAGTAVDLIAVRFFSTTAHYNIGDHVLQGGVLYRAIAATGPGAFAPGSWTRGITLADATATYLPLAGGTMTGLLLLSGEPVAALGAATKQTVDGKVAKAGDTMTGTLTIFSVDPTLNLNKTAAGQLAAITSYTNGSVRWQLRLGDNVAESGANAGSSFALARYSDAGGSLGTVFSIDRASGAGLFAQPLTVAAPTAGSHAATKAYVDAGAPAGAILAFAGPTPPAGWFACNGQNVSRTGNPNLYATIGGYFGTGDGSTTFGLPDLRGRVPAGIDDMGGAAGAAGRLAIGGTGGFASVGLAGNGGEQGHTTTPNESAKHQHNIGFNRDAVSASGGSTGRVTIILPDGTGGSNTATAGPAFAYNDQAHNNMQPTLLVNYIIKGG